MVWRAFRRGTRKIIEGKQNNTDNTTLRVGNRFLNKLLKTFES